MRPLTDYLPDQYRGQAHQQFMQRVAQQQPLDYSSWSNEMLAQYQRFMAETIEVPLATRMMEAKSEHQQAITGAIRDHIRRTLPDDLHGPVGDDIANALYEVKEYHWIGPDGFAEHWGYELVFKLDEEFHTVQRQFTVSPPVTQQRTTDGNYPIPYAKILGTLTLTHDEAVLLATAL